MQAPIPKRVIVYTILAFILIVLLAVGGAAGCKSYNRYQKQADARNAVKVTTINIKKAQQQAKVIAAQDASIKARADQRFIAAQGIRKAQDEVAKTLTPLYVQFEAIEAQKQIATSGKNNTVIYVPAGTNGTPVITQGAEASKNPLLSPQP